MFILINKPKGISSFKALAIAQKKLSQELGIKKIKMGHAGTLDPLAEGLLLCAVSEGTKMLSYLLLSDKEYIATLTLGAESETDDDEGEKTVFPNARHNNPSKENIEAALEKFVGKITQTPPKYSALKIDGKRACDRVRNGETVEIKSRQVDIFSIEILNYTYPFLTIKVHCGTGTYIRSLARDIGVALQCGAYLSFLQRTKIGNFLLHQSVLPEEVTLSDIKDFLQKHFSMPSVNITKAEYKDLCQGKYISHPTSEKEQEMIVADQSHHVLGLVRCFEDTLRPKSMMQNLL